MPPSVVQELSLINEVETAIFLIQEGLISLNMLDGANDFAHLPIMLLSSGFERLLKVVICLDHLEKNGDFPSVSSFRKTRTHNIPQLLDSVIEIAIGWGYHSRCKAAEDDMDFLKSDSDLRDLVELLGEFGDRTRYYDLNVIIGEKNYGEHPKEGFERYSLKIYMRRPDWKERIAAGNVGEKIDEDIRLLNQHITFVLQRFARAVCRLFTLGQLGALGNQVTGHIYVFLTLTDQELAKVQPRWFERSREIGGRK